MNYRKTVRKCHDTCRKNGYHTYADVSMLGSRRGVSQYLQFFVEDLDMYQMLPHPYLIYFHGGPGRKTNWLIDLANQLGTFIWECIESRIMSDDIEKYTYVNIGQL